MKLRNKKTGEIIETYPGRFVINSGELIRQYDSLAELNEEWEDYEEPKGSALDLMILTLTNFIENEPDEDKVDLEDCKQMLEKLKAWERLKDKGFKFGRWQFLDDRSGVWVRGNYAPDIVDELDVLFGGEE